MGFGYPVALDLEGRRCVVIGGGTVAEHKVGGLLDAGASVTVVASDFTPGIQEGGATGRVNLVQRAYRRGDLRGAFLAIAATDDSAVNAEIFEEASAAGVLVNAVDDVEHCHFAVPSIVRRGDLSISISTAGKAPALAKRLRRRLSEEFGPEWGELVEVLSEVRAEAIEHRCAGFDIWAQRWQQALRQDLAGMIREGRADEVRHLVKSCLAGEAEPVGSVAIVGAGPGDPGLISVRGKELLESADVVVHDRLVNRALLEGKETIDAGKQPGSHRVDQHQINDLLVRLAREGKRVVRLKGGDPFVFGRGAEEAEALAAAGVAFEIVPGVTSAVAALESAGIPVTDRRWASSVAIVTGHCATGEVDWERLATAVDTLVVMMGIAHLGEMAKRLLNAGRLPETPAAIVQNGTLPTQRVVVADLVNIADAAGLAEIGPPAVIVIGEIVRVRDSIRKHLDVAEA